MKPWREATERDVNKRDVNERDNRQLRPAREEKHQWERRWMIKTNKMRHVSVLEVSLFVKWPSFLLNFFYWLDYQLVGLWKRKKTIILK